MKTILLQINQMLFRLQNLFLFVLILTFLSNSLSAESLAVPGNVSDFRYYESSHTTAAAMLLKYWNVSTLPDVVLGADVETSISSCHCHQGGISFLKIKDGLNDWMILNGYDAKATQYALRSKDPGETTGFSSAVQEIKEGRPFLITYSLDVASEKDLTSSLTSTERVSFLVVGSKEDSKKQFLEVDLPKGWEKDPSIQRMSPQFLPDKGRKDPNLRLIPWMPKTGNAVVTFLSKPVPRRKP